jgi:hypothetical protein
MIQFARTLTLALALGVSLALAGCSEPALDDPPADGTADGPIEITDNPPPLPPEAEDVHPTEGPHHGSLIELGGEEYHGELVHDETGGTVTVYVLDGSAKKVVPIDSPAVTINVKHAGGASQFQLAAQADETDPEGRSSRFVTDDAELGKLLDAEGAEARLTLKIEGKSYSGAIAHEHDHE